MSASEIRAAVEAARPRLPQLAADYADTAIAAGKTVQTVKSDLVDLMLKGDPANTRSAARASMVRQIAAKYGADAAALAAASAAPSRRQDVDPKARTIGDRSALVQPAQASAREKGADGLTTGQRSMLALVERTQGKAARAKAEARFGIRTA